MPKQSAKSNKNYIVSLGNGRGYYNANVSWRGVSREEATPYTSKEALTLRNYLAQPRIGYTGAEIEHITPTTPKP